MQNILYDVHKNTVHAWINKHGLLTNDDIRPILILGRDLKKFLQERRTQNKRKCLPHEFYCMKCRKPQIPAGNMADYLPMTETTGRLISLCPVCESLINKFFSLSKIQSIKGEITVTIPEGTKTHNQED